MNAWWRMDEQERERKALTRGGREASYKNMDRQAMRAVGEQNRASRSTLQ